MTNFGFCNGIKPVLVIQKPVVQTEIRLKFQDSEYNFDQLKNDVKSDQWIPIYNSKNTPEITKTGKFPDIALTQSKLYNDQSKNPLKLELFDLKQD